MKKEFISLDTKNANVPEIHKLLLGGIAPRPIALVSTISLSGINNLSPFSFFNAFGANPPTVAFSPANRGRDGSTKDTLNNLKEVPECVVQSVSFEMVQQISLASTEYDSEIDEFVKSGLTPIDSESVKPKRVLESPFHMECKVQQIVPLGNFNGSGNLVICEVLKFHYDPNIIKDGIIQPDLINLVGRNSANFYTKACGDAIFEVAKPISNKGIGIDQLPKNIRESEILSANNLGQLGNIEELPNEKVLKEFIKTYQDEKFKIGNSFEYVNSGDYKKMYTAGLMYFKIDSTKSMDLIELASKLSLENNNVDFAISALLSWNILNNK